MVNQENTIPKQISENILYNPFVPTQFDYILDNSFKGEMESAMSILKDGFIERNKIFLDENNLSIRIDGFIIGSIINEGEMTFHIKLIDENGNDVTIKNLLNLK